MEGQVFRLRLSSTAALPLLAWIAATFAQAPPTLSSAREVEEFTQAYYLTPQPEMVAPLMQALHDTAMFHSAAAAPPYVGFFSEVFAANAGRLGEWRRQVERLPHPAKGVMELAMSVSRSGGVLRAEGLSAALNDMYWGAFFASGDERYIDRLIGQLRFSDERNDYEIFGVGWTSKWSLASNAQSHARVLARLQAAKATSDQRTQQIIDEVLTRDPDSIRQESIEIARQRWGRR